MSWDWLEPRDGDRRTQRLAGALAFIASAVLVPAQGTVELLQGTPLTLTVEDPTDHTSVIHMFIVPVFLLLGALGLWKAPLRYFGPTIMAFGILGIINSTALGMQSGNITTRHATYYILASVTISFLFRTSVSLTFAMFASSLAFITCFHNGGPHSGIVNGMLTVTVVLTITISLALTADSYTRSYNDLQRHAETDALTGLATRHAMERFAVKALDGQPSSGDGSASLAMVSLDLDSFKLINDNHGHRAGDAVLLRVAATLRELLPEGGLAVRLGGDEFALLVPNMASQEVQQLALLVTERVEATPVTVSDDAAPIEPLVSTGWASVETPQSFNDLYMKSDEALYKVKHARRKQRVLVSTQPDSYQGSQ